MEVFVAIADAGSFAKAADRMRLSPTAVSRAISALEDRLGVQLLIRTTRSISLTESGGRFLDNSRRILSELEVAEKDALGEAAVPTGHLTLTGSVTLGRLILPPVTCAFLREYPKIDVSILLVDRVVNMIDEGFDVGLRVGELPDSSLVARRVGAVRRVLVASPEYLARRGTPMTPGDLRAHSFIAFTGHMPNRQWRYVDGGVTGQVAIAPRLEVSDDIAALDAAMAGDGITNTLSYNAADKIRAGKLVLVLGRYTPPPSPVHLIYPQSRIVAPKIRAFLEFASPRVCALLSDVDVAVDR